MADPCILLDKKNICSQLHDKTIFLELFEEINSTNDYLKTVASSSAPRLCISEAQTHGRGQFQRHWHSPFGKNIYLSLLYSFYQNLNALSGLSLIVGLALCRSLEKTCQFKKPLLIKWPNDVMIDQKKLAGSLIEIQANTPKLCSVIIGIGLNVNIETNNYPLITQPWTSLQAINNQFYDRNKLCAQIINDLLEVIQQFQQYGFPSFFNEWEQRDALLHNTISLRAGNETLHGQVMGVTEQGFLRVKLANGEEQIFSSGNASILKK